MPKIQTYTTNNPDDGYLEVWTDSDGRNPMIKEFGERPEPVSETTYPVHKLEEIQNLAQMWVDIKNGQA